MEIIRRDADNVFYRIFQGHTTRQIDGHTGRPALSGAWYYEPEDYDGDVLWSSAYDSAEDAIEATSDDGPARG